MKALAAGTIVLFLLLPLAANGKPIKGAGAMTCGSWLEARKKDEHFPYLYWLQGFISSYNQYSYAGKNPNGIFGSTDSNALSAWMDNYCRAHPLESVYEGTLKLVEELSGKAK